MAEESGLLAWTGMNQLTGMDQLTGMESRLFLGVMESGVELAQKSIIWFSMAVALWQILLIVGNLFSTGARGLTGTLGRYLDVGHPLPEDGKDTLIGANVKDLLEMTYWTIKFLEDFEKQYRSSGVGSTISRADQSPSDRVYGEDSMFGPNSRFVLKMMRYMAKFVSNFDRFFKRSSKD